MTEDELRARILGLVGEYARTRWSPRPFAPGIDLVPAACKVFDGDDVRNLVDASLDFWLTAGRYADRFEADFPAVLGARHALLVNSGSSANLLAVSALTSPKLGDRRLRPGDEVITVAAGFPTTINPILQNGLVPVFLDVVVPTWNIDASLLQPALSDRTRAIMVAHTLGNPFDLDAVMAFARKHDLWVIEDCCDAVGAEYGGRRVGGFGHLATASFYPAHHMTMGEGGAVVTSDPVLKRLVASFRDWGRACWCGPGHDNTCRRRFKWQLGDLPAGYDHKYTFEHIGYNLKVTDMQAAIGVSQLAKLDGFIAARRRNFQALRDGLADLDDVLILPEATPGSSPSWFGFPFAVRDGAPFTRDDLVARLEAARVSTRLLFCGNVLRQPGYRDIPHRKIGDLPNTDFAMRNVLWVGVHPALTPPMIDHMQDTIRAACRG